MPNWQEIGVIVAAGAFLLNLAGMLVGYGKIVQMVSDLRKSRETHDEESRAAVAELKQQINSVERELHRVETDAAKTYVTTAAVDSLRKDVTDGMRQITERLDRVLERQTHSRT